MPASIECENYEPVYAGLGVRLFAFGIDMLISGIIVLIFKLSFSRAGGFFGEPILFSFTPLDIAAYLLGISYFVVFTYFSGATIGKLIFKLRVISLAPEADLTFFDILYRETIGRYLSGLLMIGYIYAACNAKKQAFHDVLCDTGVVYAFKPPYYYPNNNTNSNNTGNYNTPYTETSDYSGYNTSYNAPQSTPYSSPYDTSYNPAGNSSGNSSSSGNYNSPYSGNYDSPYIGSKESTNTSPDIT